MTSVSTFLIIYVFHSWKFVWLKQSNNHPPLSFTKLHNLSLFPFENSFVLFVVMSCIVALNYGSCLPSAPFAPICPHLTLSPPVHFCKMSEQTHDVHFRRHFCKC